MSVNVESVNPCCIKTRGKPYSHNNFCRASNPIIFFLFHQQIIYKVDVCFCFFPKYHMYTFFYLYSSVKQEPKRHFCCFFWCRFFWWTWKFHGSCYLLLIQLPAPSPPAATPTAANTDDNPRQHKIFRWWSWLEWRSRKRSDGWGEGWRWRVMRRREAFHGRQILTHQKEYENKWNEGYRGTWRKTSRERECASESKWVSEWVDRTWKSLRMKVNQPMKVSEWVNKKRVIKWFDN